MKRPHSFGLDRFSGLYLWALFIIVFSIWQPSLFLTKANIDSIAAGQAVTGIIALAVLVPIITGAFDLSVGATANFTAILAINLQVQHHISIPVAIILSVVAGSFIGAFNGFLVVKLRVNSFIATLGVGSIVLALMTMISANSQPLPPSSPSWGNLTQRSFGGFEIVFFYLIVIALIFWWALEHTPAGRYMYAIGSNAEATRLSGVAVSKWIWTSLIVSGTMAGVAGVAFGSQLGPSLTFGQGMLLPAFAAAFLGSTQIKPGKFNVWGTILAIYVLATGVAGFQYVTGVQWLSDMFNGVALVSAVAFAIWRQQVSTKHRELSMRPAPLNDSSEPPSKFDGEALPASDIGPSSSLEAAEELGESPDFAS